MPPSPILIAGPCAAESREQVLQTARAIAAMPRPAWLGQVIFRAGVWKPRTSPDTFQGIGEEALLWLQQVQQQTGMPVAVEVATSEQVQKAITAGIDVLWIGARTSANPIQVQVIADSITKAIASHHTKNENTPPLAIAIKNPMHDDTDLWQGNIERLLRTGLPVWAVHRGCNHRSCWGMAFTLRQRMPSVPLLLDPSHMSGDRKQVPSLCHTAATLGYDGWMIEVHPTPEQAWSDARQQISPSSLANCLCQPQTADDLIWLRYQMDEIDDDLWQTIAHRMQISRQIGQYKQQRGMEVVQPARFQHILQRRLVWAKQQGLPADTVRQIMTALHEESIRQQQ